MKRHTKEKLWTIWSIIATLLVIAFAIAAANEALTPYYEMLDKL